MAIHADQVLRSHHILALIQGQALGQLTVPHAEWTAFLNAVRTQEL
ncbi:DUF397 domain-containing protein [Lipingzhangella sp. LS1_29]|uniref:DUF397 domain-containing protein n=1 Tax=Lipingzhangella rawalii TaxID=2055835 RepID=A0ABU2HAU4_9ACTN|nr:DUF397 domain-containing protein [Lipingzhangella rawalii]